ncbi:MAG: tetratricopeptide repeat protein [Acidobacteria bacterium]|nr:tetratricopeptide repeat protein [Acidobacteriota bacterium]
MKGVRIGFLLFLSAWAISAEAQRPGVENPDRVPSAPELQREANLIVRVRDVKGVPLSHQAIVSLYSGLNSLLLIEPTREGGQAVFRRISRGGYYFVEVEALGYETAREEVLVAGSVNYALVFLTPESPVKSTAAPPGPPVLAPKARKEVERGLKALEANNLEEARTRFERALKLAPGHPEVNYLVGLVYFRLGELGKARTHLEKATRLAPEHGSVLLILGAVLFQLQDYRQATTILERALEVQPQFWAGHDLLARSYAIEGQLEKARAHAERALELGGDKSPTLLFFLAELLARLGERDKAIEQAEVFLARHPDHELAAEAQSLLARLRSERQASPQPASLASPAVLATPGLAAAVAVPPAPTWAPPDLDEVRPPVLTDVSCNQPEVVGALKRHATELVDNLQRFTATEQVESERVDEAGKVRASKARTFEYVVFIEKTPAGTLSVQEKRNGRVGLESFATYATGLAAMALVFHPIYAEDFAFQCEGLSPENGQAAWQVYFRQREDRQARVASLRRRSGLYQLPLKGRVWLSATSYKIARLEIDLVSPIPAIELDRHHIAIEYRPVTFVRNHSRLWLPHTAELFLQLSGRRYHHRHSFRDYQLFAVEVDERVQNVSQP